MAKDLGKIISRDLFYFSSALLVAAIGLELIWPNIILVYLNINYLVLLNFVFGVISLIKK